LILVPNITLQLQRKDKITSFFLEPHENIDDLVSLNSEKIARFNIITYQSLTQSSEGDDEIYQQTLRSWFNDLKEEFDSFDSFALYVESLKDFNAQEYEENISKYRKKQKVSSNVDKLLTDKIKQYFSLLKEANVTALVLDEAHHLTSWWSTVAFHLREYLQHPYVIGLTATPPFDDPDFFILDPSYANLLGEVDYYVPTPAVVKSGKLAPYQDLVYLVEPGDSIASTLATYQENLDAFLVAHKDDICLMLHQYISKDFDNLIDKK
jgi:superfamily II DNA or RNA helicase